MNDDSAPSQTHQRSWLERLSNALLREPQDRAQLVSLLRDAQQRDLLDADALAMIEGVLAVSLLQVRDIMIPRAQMIMIEHDATLDQIFPIVVEHGHSRYPIMGEDRDDVIGILLAKDLLSYVSEAAAKTFDIAKIMRPAVFVPESKRLDVMLREFRLNRNHMAFVVDEYGGIAGLITIEDVLEEIVGNIEDEYDIEEEPNIKEEGKNAYLVKGLTPIEEFNKALNEKLSDEEFDTVGGYVMNLFGHLPKLGESIEFGKIKVKVLSADERNIESLQVTVTAAAAKAAKA